MATKHMRNWQTTKSHTPYFDNIEISKALVQSHRTIQSLQVQNMIIIISIVPIQLYACFLETLQPISYFLTSVANLGWQIAICHSSCSLAIWLLIIQCCVHESLHGKKKSAKNRQILKIFSPKQPDFYDNFQQVVKNIGGFCFLKILSYLVRNQIWLKHFLDDRHFDYITKNFKETLDPGAQKCNLRQPQSPTHLTLCHPSSKRRCKQLIGFNTCLVNTAFPF